MTNLRERLMRALELPADHYLKRERDALDRLKPLLLALVDVATAANRLDDCLCEFGTDANGSCSEYGGLLGDALAALDAKLKEMEGV